MSASADSVSPALRWPGRPPLGLLDPLVDQLGADHRVRHPPGRLVARHHVDVQRYGDSVLLEGRQFDVRELQGGHLGQAERGDRGHVEQSTSLRVSSA